MKLYIHQRTIPADLETPVGIYLKLRDLHPCSVLLESSDYHTAHNSVSYIGIEPTGEFRVAGGQITERYPDGNVITSDILDGSEVLDRMGAYTKALELDQTIEYPGLFGYTAYDAVRYFEKVNIDIDKGATPDVPDMLYILYRYVIKVNHFRNQMTVTEVVPENTLSGIDSLLGLLRNHNVAEYGFAAVGDPQSPISDDRYVEMVKQGIAHCRRGDVFQVVLSRRFEQRFTGDEFCLYRALRCINPSPYLFYFDFGSFRVLGSSPETHLRVTGRKAYIDPIAGTFPRTGNDAKDSELAEALLVDAKENAEHVMLVDLARNDLARGGGEVSIEFLRQIQYYSHVIHMVSRVSATLPEGSDPLKLFAGTFPAGTLSGAPKVRAMQIINELEPHNRGIYGGCIGMIGLDGNLNQAITIRSFLSHNRVLYSQAGAGIVARSNPESELHETRNKLGALTKAIDYAQSFLNS